MSTPGKILASAFALLASSLLLELRNSFGLTRLPTNAQNSLSIRLRNTTRKFRWKWLPHQAFRILLFSGAAFLPGYLLSKLGSLSPNRPPIAIALTIFIVGTIAFWYKKKWLFAYGITEIGFGVISSYQVANGSKFAGVIFAKWTVLVGSVYVISRGWSNISDARRKRTSSVEQGWIVSLDSEIRAKNRELLAAQSTARRGPTAEVFVGRHIYVSPIANLMRWTFSNFAFGLRRRDSAKEWD